MSENRVLKPCPFCGGEADRQITDHGEGKVCAVIVCQKCGARVFKIGKIETTATEAGEVWNRREEIPDGEAQMEADFWKNDKEMSLNLRYNTAKPSDREEAARLIESYFNAAQRIRRWPAMEALASGYNPLGHIRLALMGNHGQTEYDRGVRNGLRIAAGYIEQREPELEKSGYLKEDKPPADREVFEKTVKIKVYTYIEDEDGNVTISADKPADFEAQFKAFKAAVAPLREYLDKYGDPHTSITVTQDGATENRGERFVTFEPENLPCWKPKIIRGQPEYVCPHCGQDGGTAAPLAAFCPNCGEAVDNTPAKFNDDFERQGNEWKVKEGRGE